MIDINKQIQYQGKFILGCSTRKIYVATALRHTHADAVSKSKDRGDERRCTPCNLDHNECHSDSVNISVNCIMKSKLSIPCK